MGSEITPLRKTEIERIKPYPAGKQPAVNPPTDQPVGIFDSGVGGLTVLKVFNEKLPQEDVIYLADTIRIPYGGRPPQEIIKINQHILSYFSERNVKMVIMACGTSSAIAFPVLKDKYPFPIISLIEPGSEAAVEASQNGKIGILATVGTINSGAYQKQIKEIKKEAEVLGEACPLFVPLIEGGFYQAEETRKVAREYLKPLLALGVDTIILGCTHYPHLLPLLTEIAGPSVTFIDPAERAVEAAQKTLKKMNLLSPRTSSGEIEYQVTGQELQFEELGSRLLGRPVALAKKLVLGGI